MHVMTSQITDTRLSVQQFGLTSNKVSNFALLALCEGKPLVAGGEGYVFIFVGLFVGLLATLQKARERISPKFSGYVQHGTF